MTYREAQLPEGLRGALIRPDSPSGLGVVVLGGSSGRVDVDRAKLFASRGATAIALQWFGGEGQPPSVCEIALESFTPATDALVNLGCDRIAYVGTSKGAEAALLLAAHDPRLDAVVAISPSSVVWANTGPGRNGEHGVPYSSFTLGARPLPFVPYDAAALAEVNWTPPIAYLELHIKSLAAVDPARRAEAEIPVERSNATFVLVAGGDDALTMSGFFATEIADRLAAHGKTAHVVYNALAGHRVLLPGETTPRSTLNLHGGTDAADRTLGAAAWRVIAEVLGFDP